MHGEGPALLFENRQQHLEVRAFTKQGKRVSHFSHFLLPRFAFSRVLTLTLKRLLRNQSLCNKVEKEGKELKNKEYVMALIIKCQDTLEILVRRAIVEASEEYTMKQIERESSTARSTR